MTTEFQKYRFADFLRASAVAPFASIPAVLLLDYLYVFASGSIFASPLGIMPFFGRLALLLISLSLPSAYISTAIFGALGVGIANSARVLLTVPIGAFAGVVCGFITGLLWLLFLAGDISFDLSLLSEARWVYVLVGASCGLFVGMAYPVLLNLSVQHSSTDRNVSP